MNAYIAGGWFTPEQRKARDEVIKVCKTVGMTYYSPEHDFLYVHGITSGAEALKANCDYINQSDLVIASTEGKDMGTLWECGYAFAKDIPVVYYFKSGGKFNLMLGQTARAVCVRPEDLRGYLATVLIHNAVLYIPYIGEME